MCSGGMRTCGVGMRIAPSGRTSALLLTMIRAAMTTFFIVGVSLLGVRVLFITATKTTVFRALAVTSASGATRAPCIAR